MPSYYNDSSWINEAQIPGSYETSKGQKIDFEWDEDVEQINRGWVVHKLEAYVNGKNVGYLKISYIPKENFKYYYPNIFHWAAMRRKLHHWNKQKGSRRYNKIQSMSKSELLSARVHDLTKKVDAWSDWLSKDDIAKMLDREKEEYIRDAKIKMERKHGNAYKEFKDFHVDKPLVDYIKVNKNWRRQGIGFALYSAGAKKMASKFSLPLYASGLQSDLAKAAWEKLTRVLPVRSETSLSGKKRIYIDYT